MPTPSLIIVPSRWKTGNPGKLYSQIPTNGNGDFNVTGVVTGGTSIGTRVNNLGYIEPITTSGTPRLDYYTSSGTPGCPALLVEPSGTNSFQRSNELNIGFPWTQDNISFTTGSTSAFTSPDGTTNSFLLADTSGNTRHRISQQLTTSFVSGTTYTVSIFVKKNSSGRFLLLNANTAFGARAALNLDTLAITNIDGSGASVENYGNGWYRFLIRGTATSTQVTTVFIQMQDAATDVPYIGNGSSFYLFGAQLETSSVATSYIPTTAVTGSRAADVISVSGAVSGSIGQTEGTLYAEVDYRNFSTATQGILQLFLDGSNRLGIATYRDGVNNRFQGYVVVAGNVLVNINTTISSAGIYKIAFAYKQDDFAFYINGVQIGTDIGGNIPSNLSTIHLGHTNGSSQFNDRIRAAALYTTRLTNADLMLLTMPGNNTYLPQAVWDNYLSRTGNTEVPDCLYTRHADLLDV